MGGYRHPFETLLLLQPEFESGNWDPFIAIFLIYLTFNIDMDTDSLPVGGAINVVSDGAPAPDSGPAWQSPREIRFACNAPPPTTSLTVQFFNHASGFKSADGIPIEPQGPFDIFFPRP